MAKGKRFFTRLYSHIKPINMQKEANKIVDSTLLITPQGTVITFTGIVVDLFNPNPDHIVLEDIAHGLAHTCRWNGHTKTFYSVAEHSVAVTRRVKDGQKLIALFHDAEEAYWGDIIRPIKALLPVEIITKIVEFRQVIFNKWEIPELTAEVNAADDVEMKWDYNNLIKPPSAEMIYQGMLPKEAKKLWLATAAQLLNL